MNRILGPPSQRTIISHYARYFQQDDTKTYDRRVQILFVLAISIFFFSSLILMRIFWIIKRPRPQTPPFRPKPSSGERNTTSSGESDPTHLLVVLGSGGHTAEMLNILSNLPELFTRFTQRTYVVSSGDGFSAQKARDFEQSHDPATRPASSRKSRGPAYSGTFEIVSVRRARRVHQGVLTAPYTTVLCLWDCIKVLRARHDDQQRTKQTHPYPDLILTNGPGTGVCVVLAALILLFFDLGSNINNHHYPAGPVEEGQETFDETGSMRTVFIESWARVQTLSLSGRILRPVVDRFLVQWPQLARRYDGAEYVGGLVS